MHRFVTYLPGSKLATAVCSNAGWYTVPETGVSFPYGIDNGHLLTEDLTAAFSRKLIIYLGKNGTNGNAGLRRNAVVDEQQGTNRLVRGQYYFETAQTTAVNMGATYNWEKHELEDVGHYPQLMANDALQYLLSNLLSNNNTIISKELSVFPNPVDNLLTFYNLKIKSSKVQVFSISGELLSTNNFSDFSSNQKIIFSKFSKGIYFLKIIIEKGAITQKII